jgi:hypothetical protein
LCRSCALDCVVPRSRIPINNASVKRFTIAYRVPCNRHLSECEIQVLLFAGRPAIYTRGRLLDQAPQMLRSIRVYLNERTVPLNLPPSASLPVSENPFLSLGLPEAIAPMPFGHPLFCSAHREAPPNAANPGQSKPLAASPV